MSETETSAVAAAIHSVVENIHNLPASSSVTSSKYTTPRLFGRKKTVHDILGGGHCADVLLWRKKHLSATAVLGTTAAYVLFEWCGYTLLTVLSNALLILIVVLFLWSNAAALLNRPPPPIPELQLSEDFVEHTAQTLRVEVNRSLAIVHAIALGKDYKLFLKTIAGLWLLSILGGWCHFLTFAYIAVIISHTLPVLYDKYEDEIEHYLKIAYDESKKQYRKIDELVLSKIPRAPPKEKKLL